MNGDKFKSYALSVNLNRTRVDHLTLPEQHQRFIQFSKDAFGIHKRAQAMFQEYHHPYTNHQVVVKYLREIALQDLWFYKSHDASVEALLILVEIMDQLCQKVMDTGLLERLIQTILEVSENLISTSDRTEFHGIIDQLLAIAATTIAVHEAVAVRCAGLLKSMTTALVSCPRYRDKLTALLRSLLVKNADFWERTSAIESWYESRCDIFSADYRSRMAELGRHFFGDLKKKIQAADGWGELIRLDDFSSILKKFRHLMDENSTQLDRIYYILYLLHLPGMTQQKDPLLWDLNRGIRALQQACSFQELSIFVDRVFQFFKELDDSHMTTVLDCLLTLGKEIYATGNQGLVIQFIDRLIAFGFVKPQYHGIDPDWQSRTDPNHVKCIRLWLSLIECNPDWSLKLLSGLIVNLKTAGIFISDTDLFQRDVSQLLNAKIASGFVLIKQLARLFPVYFNEIGAEGELRDITTGMDELSRRQDRLIHFLRKQVHTESNNTHIRMVELVARFWFDGTRAELDGLLPDDVRESLKTDGEWYQPVHETINALCTGLKVSPELLLSYTADSILAHGEELAREQKHGLKRIWYLVRLQALLKEKYTIDATGAVPQMRRLPVFSGDEISALVGLVESGNPEEMVALVFSFMERLKGIILDPEVSSGREDIYYKRHIAAGIPSMYGRYLEAKFEALGLTFRLEKLAADRIQRMMDQTNLRYITAQTLRRIAKILQLFRQGLALDGVVNEGFNANLEMLQFSLKTSSFSMDQYLNLFQFMMGNVKEIIQECFLRLHEMTLRSILKQQAAEEESHSEAQGMQATLHRQAEQFYREVISESFLIQQLDQFVGKVMNSLGVMVAGLTPDIMQKVMSFDPDLLSSSMVEKDGELDNPVFLGAKGYFLKKLSSFGFPIPPGFVLTTEIFRRKDVILRYRELSFEIMQLIRGRLKELEARSGRTFGDAANPLLLSVRSGGAISMPGAMNTFLNVGMNERLAEDLSQKPEYAWTAWDCYRRFLQSWGMAYGVARDVFDEIILHYKEYYGVAAKSHFTPKQMRIIALNYKDVMVERGVAFETEPFKQLMQAVFFVLDSWYTNRAKIYRKQLQIAEEWGTAVIIQQMVLGNLTANSGTGVIFTKDPFVPKPGISLYGDFTLMSQGEDVVGGLVYTLPVSERQRLRDRAAEPDSDMSLETDFPEIYQELVNRAHELIHVRGFGHQEIEFTFESNRKEDLYILQTRDQTTPREAIIPVFEGTDVPGDEIGAGIGIGGGALNGIVAFDLADLQRITTDFSDAAKILIRPDTVPDDIGMIFESDGLLTARGGAASHAAVTAVRLGKTCVVNCRVLKVMEHEKKCIINGVEFHVGDRIGIDGRLGKIFRGHHGTVSLELI